MKIDISIFDAVSANYGPTSVQIRQFFVARNGVITLAYGSFTSTLLNIKADAEEAMQGRLKPENEGGKWPKTTLAALNHDIALTDQQVRALRHICLDYTARMQKLPQADARVSVEELTAVAFGCRSLERRHLSLACRLNGAVAANDEPPALHVQYVGETMAQFDESHHGQYYKHLHPAGRTIDGWYRSDHAEATLIADVVLSDSARRIVDAFRAEVDHVLPSEYGWFDPSSWHLTIRALVPK